MAENSAISWTDHTWNPWIGCARISPACDGCYAAGQFGMDGGRFPKRAQWGGPGKGEGTRSRTSEDYWKKPLAWNRKAAKDGTRPFVFCASLADVFDNAVPPEWRRDLFDLIRATPNLTWLPLTKRPGNIVKLWTEAIRPGSRAHERAFDENPPNFWPRNAAIGCTVVTQEEADRDVPKLLAAKAALNPAFAFLSIEPLLGPVDLTRCFWNGGAGLWRRHRNYLTGISTVENDHSDLPVRTEDEGIGRLDWVITGGETDQKTEEGMHLARPASIQWFRELRDQCAAAGVPFHFKQWGEWQPATPRPSETPGQFAFGDYEHDRASMHQTDRYPRQFTMFGARSVVERLGKAHDPCTLDGVKHDARPKVAHG